MRLGSHFMVGFSGHHVGRDHPLSSEINELGLGGVILFDRAMDGSTQNITSPAQLRDLTASLRQVAGEQLLIAADQEGGAVCRLKVCDGFPATVRATTLGACPDTGYTTARAGELARVLRRHGINCNLAPVVDLDRNPDNPVIGRWGRSFGPDSETVAMHARAWIEAHHQARVACCLKHFPGHGSSSADSHLGFVDVSKSWHEEELIPYRELIDLGLADCVMSAHVVHRGLDPQGLPATLSQPMLQGILRGHLGFKGVILSDDLQMRAIRDRWSLREAVQMAFLAGADMLVIGNNLCREPEVLRTSVQALEDLLREGALTRARLEESQQRIFLLQKKYKESIHG